MTLISALEEVRDWFQYNVCDEFTFKRPPMGNEFDAEEYSYELVTPTAYIMYPPNNCKVPSVTIQFGDGSISKFNDRGELRLRFLIATWSPGLHYLDRGNVPNFQVDNEGWRDVWNFVDLAIRKLMNTNNISERVRIKHEDSITFSPVQEQDVIASYYPHWCGWLQVTIQYGVVSTQEDITQLL